MLPERATIKGVIDTARTIRPNKGNKVRILVISVGIALLLLISLGFLELMNQSPKIQDLTVPAGQTHIVKSDEVWGTVILEKGSSLKVLRAAELMATGLYLNNASSVEVDGGFIDIVAKEPGGFAAVQGSCDRFEMNQASNQSGSLYVKGADGGKERVESRGGNAQVMLTVTSSFIINGESVYLVGGHGYDLPPAHPWTQEDINDETAHGGDATFEISLGPGAKMAYNRSDLLLLAGRGGKASDGGNGDDNKPGKGGGYSNGGAVSGQVGMGGTARVKVLGSLNNSIDIRESFIQIYGGEGGQAGDGGNGRMWETCLFCGVKPPGGGGYAGGDGGYYGVDAPNPGLVSGQVGAGGDAEMAFSSVDTAFNTSYVIVIGGEGGKAGQGGPAISGVTGGGGGYGGGGGSDYGGEPGDGNVSGSAGSGGNSSISFLHGDLSMVNSELWAFGGNGGPAGNGGRLVPAVDRFPYVDGAGGGGYGGGGGVKGGHAHVREAGSTLVTGNVGSGGQADIIIEAVDANLDGNLFQIVGGNGGSGGAGGSGFKGQNGGAGGGGLGGGGGGDSSANGGSTIVSGHVSDGGNSSFHLKTAGGVRSNNTLFVLGGDGGCGGANGYGNHDWSGGNGGGGGYGGGGGGDEGVYSGGSTTVDETVGTGGTVSTDFGSDIGAVNNWNIMNRNGSGGSPDAPGDSTQGGEGLGTQKHDPRPYVSVVEMDVDKDRILPGDDVKVTAVIKNVGEVEASNITVLAKVTGTDFKKVWWISSLGAGKSQRIEFSFKATQDHHTISVSAEVLTAALAPSTVYMDMAFHDVKHEMRYHLSNPGESWLSSHLRPLCLNPYLFVISLSAFIAVLTVAYRRGKKKRLDDSQDGLKERNVPRTRHKD